MGFRFQKRIKLGKGFGLNISKSSIMPSYRTKSGSVSSKGYSLKTGIPGLTFRKNFNRKKNSGCVLVLSIFFLIPFFIIVTSSCQEERKEGSIIETTSNNYTKGKEFIIKNKTENVMIEIKNKEPSEEEVDKVLKEFIVLFYDLNRFKKENDFKKYGFATGGPYNKWLKQLERLKKKSNILIRKGLFASELEILGFSYVTSKGRETDVTRRLNKIISDTILSN